MKTILFIILFTALAYSQVTVQYTVTFDSASTTGSTVTLPRDLFLSGVVMPDSVSDSLYFQAYIVDQWVTIRDEAGAIYYVKPNYSTYSAIALKPTVMYPWKVVRVRTTDSTPDVTTMYVIGRQY